jgi:hypothetical protein
MGIADTQWQISGHRGVTGAIDPISDKRAKLALDPSQSSHHQADIESNVTLEKANGAHQK